jgi:hypothetical protein
MENSRDLPQRARRGSRRKKMKGEIASGEKERGDALGLLAWVALLAFIVNELQRRCVGNEGGEGE